MLCSATSKISRRRLTYHRIVFSWSLEPEARAWLLVAWVVSQEITSLLFFKARTSYQHVARRQPPARFWSKCAFIEYLYYEPKAQGQTARIGDAAQFLQVTIWKCAWNQDSMTSFAMHGCFLKRHCWKKYTTCGINFGFRNEPSLRQSESQWRYADSWACDTAAKISSSVCTCRRWCFL